MLLVAALLIPLFSTPSTAASLRAPGVERLTGDAILLMPPRVEVFEVAPGGVALLKPEWTQSARDHVQAALDRLLGRAGSVIARYEAPADADRADRHAQILRVHRLLHRTIVTHCYGHYLDLPSKQGRLDWSLGPAAGILREATTSARWALFLEVSDRRLSRHFVRFGTLGDEVAATASVLDLATGDILWFNHEQGGGIGTAAAALDTMKRLLRGLPF